VYDPRQALFFQRSVHLPRWLEQFATPSNLVYTRAISEPGAAVKVTGKLAGTTLALLSAVDDTLNSVSKHDRPLFNILRVKRDLGDHLGSA